MAWKLWGKRLALGAMFVFTLLACRTSDVLLAQNQPTPTRVVRPTFTPAPPTATTAPTATRTRTRAPTARPTARPATAIPQPTAAPPPVSSFPWTYHALFQKCEHSGNAYIKGAIYADKNDPDSKTPGLKVRLSWSPDAAPIVDVISEDFYTFVLSGVGEGARPGTYYVWVIDGSGKRISEVSPAIVMNNLGPDRPGACWAALVDFWREPGR